MLYPVWNKLLKKEEKAIEKMAKDNKVSIYTKLDKYVREDVQKALEIAFVKSFHLVLKGGNTVIEKTCDRERRLQDFAIKKYIHEVKKDKKSLTAISKQAGKTTIKNMVISGTEGVGLGVLGVGLPDIPLFVGVILKSIYEIALDFGFGDKGDKNLFFVLKLIQGSLENQENIIRTNDDLDSIIMAEQTRSYTKEEINEQINITAQLLSKELLYAKFVQGLPIVGAVGGLSNITCLHKITKYSKMKYQKKFLYVQIKGCDIKPCETQS